MLCKYCKSKYKHTPVHTEWGACLQCSGVIDDFSLDDTDVLVDVWELANPSGRTKSKIHDDEDSRSDLYKE
jgi:hypothetical protein